MTDPFHILVVDDNESDRELTARLLQRAGLTVTAVDGAITAVAVLDSPRRIDLLLTDLHMPGQPHGIALASMARARRPSLPILYLSGTPELVAREGEDPRCALGKPVEAKVLVRKVLEALNAGETPARG